MGQTKGVSEWNDTAWSSEAPRRASCNGSSFWQSSSVLLPAALAIGAAPALAADGCDCHTAVPPIGGAPAAHAPFVAGVADCTTCHKGMTVPHPKLVEPKLEFMAEAIGNPVTMSGHLAVGQRGLNGVVVYLQQQLSGASEFTDVAQVATVRPVGGRRPPSPAVPGPRRRREPATGPSHRASPARRSSCPLWPRRGSGRASTSRRCAASARTSN